MSELNLVGAVSPIVETSLVGETNNPAIWVNPSNSEESIIIGTLNEGGLAVFDLNGAISQTILPSEVGDITYNSVDIVYGFKLNNQSIDLAVVSDRENDTLAIFNINPVTRNLENITANNVLDSIFGVDDGLATAYGLASYTSPVEEKSYIFVTQAEGNKIAQLELIGNDDGTVNAEVVRTIELPVAVGDDVEDYQAEAIVVDQEKAIVYVAVEDRIGIVKFNAEPSGDNQIEVVYSLPSTDEPAELNFDDIIVFGDSIADVGNANLATGNTVFPSPPYNNGRASNGSSIVELIAEQIGLTGSASIPSLAGGDNYAFGGAELGDGFSTLNSPNIGFQIDSYLAIDTPEATDLFLINAVSNNILTNPTVTAQTLVDFVVDHITTLANAGAKSFAITNSPPVDDSPTVVSTGLSDLAEILKIQYNQLLDTTLDQLRDDLEVTIYELDSTSIYSEIEANPTAFGFSNITDSVLDTDTLTLQGNPDEFFWWDDIHPTLSANQLFADSFVEQILESDDDSNALPLTGDLKGLGIYYGADGTGYLIASGNDDSGYAVFRREGNNQYLGNFLIDQNLDLGIDGVSQTSALDITNVSLGSSFPNGLLIVQDGANLDDSQNNTTNFKLIDWGEVANTFDPSNPSLIIDTTSFDPRNPTPQPFFNLDAWFELNINNLAPVFQGSVAETELGQIIYNFEIITDREIEINLADDVADLGTDAVFQNLVGLYEINDENGGIDIDGDGITDFLPSD